MRLLIIFVVAIFLFGCAGEKPAANDKPEIINVTALSPAPQPEPASQPKQINKIALGSSFGMCAGYCITSLVITKDSILYRKIGIPRPDAREYIPELNATSKISESEWNALVALVDINALEKLPERIGCPDCADQGAEVLQIDYDSRNKSVSFSYGENPEGLEKLLERLRAIREKMDAMIEDKRGMEIIVVK